MELVFCTNNKHKLEEVAAIVGSKISFLTLADVGFFEEIPEPYFTLEENAFAKANLVNKKISKNCFAEDTGLFVPAINNEPGVFSARYAGDKADANQNIGKLLERLQGVKNRQAYFKTVICCLLNGQSFLFDGVCEGYITEAQNGSAGFGYDPVFIPEGYNLTFAGLDPRSKNAISHRRKAFDKFSAFLAHQV